MSNLKFVSQRYLCFFILLFLYLSPVTSQNCDSVFENLFTGTPRNTLCKLQNEGPTQAVVQIGAGTSYPTSASLNFIPTKVHVVGDFFINTLANYSNVDFKIDADVSIIMNGDVTLTLDDCNLFSCNGMWNGIFMGEDCRFTSLNNTRIEDALTAVNSTDKSNSIIDISETIFNRNDIGIFLGKTNSSSANTPSIRISKGSIFSCDSPLSSQAKEIGHAGIKSNGHSIDCRLTTTRFTGLEYGIFNQSNNKDDIDARLCTFEDLLFDGIRSRNADLNIILNQFIDCSGECITINKAGQVIIKESIFRFDNLVKNDIPSGITNYEGVEIFEIDATGYVNIESSLFTMITDVNQAVTGVSLGGNSNPKASFDVRMLDNKFEIHNYSSTGIFLIGNFSSNTVSELISNTFEFENSDPNGFGCTGIQVIGTNINNLNILENDFISGETRLEMFNDELWDAGISMSSNANGTNNTITDNEFFSFFISTGFVPCINVSNFDNLKICDNFNTANNRFTFFKGTMVGINFDVNSSWGGTIVLLEEESIIGDQEHKGNMAFFPLTPDTAEADPDFALFSRFFVHEDKPDPNANTFSPFHPPFIEPEDGWWIFDPAGSPLTNCVAQRPSPLTQSKRLFNYVANNQEGELFESSDYYWNIKFKLYKLLKKYTDTNELSPFHTTFLNEHSGSNFDKIWQIEELVDQFYSNENTSLIAQAISLNNSIGGDFVPVTNFKSYYNILLSNLQNGDSKLSSNQIFALESIANQCQKEGGEAVTKARLMLPNCYANIYQSIDESCFGNRTAADVSEGLSVINESIASRSSLSQDYSSDILSPNPASSYLNISSNEAGRIEIYDIAGILLLNSTFSANSEINISLLNQGLYIAKITFGNGDKVTELFTKL